MLLQIARPFTAEVAIQNTQFDSTMLPVSHAKYSGTRGKIRITQIQLLQTKGLNETISSNPRRAS